MIKSGGREIVTAMTEFARDNKIIYEENILEDWKDSFIINCYKGICFATDCGAYRVLSF